MDDLDELLDSVRMRASAETQALVRAIEQLRAKAEAFDAIRDLLDNSVMLSEFSVAVTTIVQQATEQSKG